MDFLAVHIWQQDPVQRDLLIGELSQRGFTGFEEQDDRLTAFIPAADIPGKRELSALLSARQLRYEIQPVPDINWNAAWEHSFLPVLIDDFCGIRASFHPPLKQVKHEIVITPRMTFGTGHHATTASMIRLMQTLDLERRSVLDFGTGTGILAILAAKMGASEIIALDNDPAAIENAGENARENGESGKLLLACADRPGHARGSFDCILCNIQLQVILLHWQDLEALLRPDGRLLVSGILEADGHYLHEAAAEYHMAVERQVSEQGWLALCLRKQRRHPKR